MSTTSSMSTSGRHLAYAGRLGAEPSRLVPDAQAEQLIEGLAEAVAINGYQGVKIFEIVKHAGVSRRTFYNRFASKEECFLVAFEAITSRMSEVITRASDEADDWPGAVKAGIRTALRFLAEKPNYSRLCIVESLSSTPTVVDRYEEVMVRRLTPFLESDRIDLPPERVASLPRTLRETIGGGILWIVYQSIIKERISGVEDLAPELVEFALTPYLGLDRAQRIALEEESTVDAPGASVLNLLRSADRIRALHPARPDAPRAFELIREDRER